MARLFVYLLRVEHFRPHDIPVKRAVEAGRVAGVAGGTRLHHLVDQAVVVAVGEDPLHLLDVAALLALLPELLPAPAVVVGEAGLLREPHGLFAGIGHHQHLAALCILHDHRDEPVLEFQVRHVFRPP